MSVMREVGPPARFDKLRERPQISPITATTLALADMIGVGVFTSLGFQVQQTPSAFSVLMLWIIGGIVAMCGALSYAELAAALPRSGGEYNYLSRIYHPAVGFLAGWTSATVGFAAPTALAAMALGSYAADVTPFFPPLPTALAVTVIVTLIHLGGVRRGGLFHNASTWIKLLLIVVLIVAGFGGERAPGAGSFAPSWSDLDHIASAPFAISLVFVMYAYSGWNAATYIADEVRNPERSLPRSLIIATSIVLALYTALNAAFLYSTPMSEMSGKVDVALAVGRHLFGDFGARLVSALICFGLVSSISAMMWIGPRVAAVMGEDLHVLRVFSMQNSNGVPFVALLFQASVVIVLLITGSFETVLDFIQFSLTLCSFLAVLGVILLRLTEPDLPRPISLPGGPAIPLVFLSVTGFMLIHLFAERPFQALAGLATMLAGLVIYGASNRRLAEPSHQGTA
jgi:basic amino acid/polyamine antiporter, APA family